MKLLIIQTSPPHTASTLLVNAIYGLIPELFDKKIIYGIGDYDFESYFKNIIVIKSHNTNIDELINKYNKKYKIVFICSERQKLNYLIDNKYKTYNNVAIFDFDEINETNDYSLNQIVDNIYTKIRKVLPNIELNKTKCIERINLMNIRYEEIKSNPFSYVDNFFEIHGSHRNRLQIKNNTNNVTISPIKPNNQNNPNKLNKPNNPIKPNKLNKPNKISPFKILYIRHILNKHHILRKNNNNLKILYF